MSAVSIVIAVIAFILFIMFLKYLFTDPYTLQSMQDAKVASTISASTLATNGSGVPSTNFAYSIWFYINDWNYRYGETKVIFGRMGHKSPAGQESISGISGVDPCPVVSLGAVENNVTVSIACFPGAEHAGESGTASVVHSCSVVNVPVQKWVNVVVSVYGRTADIYLDGKLVRTCMLPGVANVASNSDVHITPMGGFDGWTSKFQYYPQPLNPQEVWNIYSKGYSSWLSMFSTYRVQLSLVQNGNAQSSVVL